MGDVNGCEIGRIVRAVAGAGCTYLSPAITAPRIVRPLGPTSFTSASVASLSAREKAWESAATAVFSNAACTPRSAWPVLEGEGEEWVAISSEQKREKGKRKHEGGDLREKEVEA